MLKKIQEEKDEIYNIGYADAVAGKERQRILRYSDDYDDGYDEGLAEIDRQKIVKKTTEN